MRCGRILIKRKENLNLGLWGDYNKTVVRCMVFECNIDSRGRAFRLRIGILAVAFGLVLATVFFVSGNLPKLAWLIPLAIVAGGAFSIFEARMGWCVVRAFGFRTSL